ncbi:anti-sigma factor [Paracoccaceae bacterium Fryx2]|nr:anti-sigma factor [Paracoccaceae bacterium Fryx2]
MQNVTEPVTDLDLAAYVDGQVDDWQRVRVEAHLARHPEAAARVMQDLHLQRELRLALTDAGSAGARQAADRLSRGLRRDGLMRRALRFAPVAVLAGVGWLGWAGLLPLGVATVNASAGPPEFVAAALAARDVSAIRFNMHSMPEVPDLDPEELRAMTGILLPAFAPDWTVLDAQVFPSPQGPGIEIVFDTPDLGRVAHFAVRPGAFAVTLPRSEPYGTLPLVWFQIGETAHVLIAETGDAERLTAAAEELSGSLY